MSRSASPQTPALPGRRPFLSDAAYFELVFVQLLPQGAGFELRQGGERVLRQLQQVGEDTHPPAPVVPESLSRVGTFGRPVPVGFGAVAKTGQRFRAYAVRDGLGATLIVWLPLTDVDATLSNLVSIELIIGAIAVVAAVGLGWWLVRIGLHPLTEVTSTADAIAGGDLARRVDVAGERTEVGRFGPRVQRDADPDRSRVRGSARASEARLRQFVADASHELRTPLTSVRGYAELFRSGAATRPDDLAKAMDRVEAEAKRMSVLVDDLLLLAGSIRVARWRRNRIDLTDVVAEAVERAEALDATHPLALESDGPVEVVGDADRLRQVVDNLLANVQRHTPVGTSAKARVRGSEGGPSSRSPTTARASPTTTSRTCSSASIALTRRARGMAADRAWVCPSWPRSPRPTAGRWR